MLLMCIVYAYVCLSVCHFCLSVCQYASTKNNFTTDLNFCCCWYWLRSSAMLTHKSRGFQVVVNINWTGSMLLSSCCCCSRSRAFFIYILFFCCTIIFLACFGHFCCCLFIFSYPSQNLPWNHPAVFYESVNRWRSWNELWHLYIYILSPRCVWPSQSWQCCYCCWLFSECLWVGPLMALSILCKWSYLCKYRYNCFVFVLFYYIV